MKPKISDSQAVMICNNIYYRRNIYKPSREELKLCLEVIKHNKLYFKDHPDKVFNLANKYNLI